MGRSVVYHVEKPIVDWNRRQFVEGWTRHSVDLPVARCDSCGDCWRGVTLDFECPKILIEEIEHYRTPFRVLSYDRFCELAKRWEAVIYSELGLEVTLKSGSDFRPLKWSIPSKPHHSIFWPLPGSIIVDQNVHDALKQLQISGCTFYPVELERVGAFEPDDDIPIPASGDVADFFSTNVPLAGPAGFGPFYELDVHEATEPSSAEPGFSTTTCATCGMQTTTKSKSYTRRVESYRDKRVLPRKYVGINDIFWSHIHYGGFMVQGKAIALLPELRNDNCRITEIQVIDDHPR